MTKGPLLWPVSPRDCQQPLTNQSRNKSNNSKVFKSNFANNDGANRSSQTEKK